MSSSVPNTLDATTDDPGVFSKILTNDAIKADSRDNAINQNWVGVGSESLTTNSTRERPEGEDRNRPLHEEVYHTYFGTGHALGTLPGRSGATV